MRLFRLRLPRVARLRFILRLPLVASCGYSCRILRFAHCARLLVICARWLIAVTLRCSYGTFTFTVGYSRTRTCGYYVLPVVVTRLLRYTFTTRCLRTLICCYTVCTFRLRLRTLRSRYSVTPRFSHVHRVPAVGLHCRSLRLRLRYHWLVAVCVTFTAVCLIAFALRTRLRCYVHLIL